MNPQMERMMRAMGEAVPVQKRLLEVNPSHPLITKLAGIVQSDEADERVSEYAEMLYDQALLSEGGQPKSPAAFAKRVANVMAATL